MFNFNNGTNTERLDTVILAIFDKMDAMVVDSKEYADVANNLVKLMTLRNETLKTEAEAHNESTKLDIDEEQLTFEKEKIASWRPSPDAIVGAAASILGIVAVLHYEKIGVVTSKALGFITKLK